MELWALWHAYFREVRVWQIRLGERDGAKTAFPEAGVGSFSYASLCLTHTLTRKEEKRIDLKSKDVHMYILLSGTCLQELPGHSYVFRSKSCSELEGKYSREQYMHNRAVTDPNR